MSTVLSRWTGKLAGRRKLLASAEASVKYWAKRAGSARGKQMLREAVARRALRRSQVAEAERVVARHSDISTVSNAGIAFVAGFEGFRSNPYQDAVGVWTIGFGETKGIHSGTAPWSRAKAATALRTRLNRDYLAPVLELADRVGLELTQREADALASLVYNLGPGILDDGRSMGEAIRSKSRARIADAFLVYDKADGRTLAGLTRRRKAERAMFLKAK